MSATGLKQNHTDIGYYVPVASLVGQIYGLTTTGGALTLSTASWANTVGTKYPLSSINAAGAGILKDMGKTVVSSLRTFRKVQLVHPLAVAPSTFGVGGRAGTNTEDFYTGYIELGFEGYGTPAPVAHFGR